MEWVQPVVDFLKNYGPGLTLLVTWATLLWVYVRTRRDFAGRRFLDQVNFSLNVVTDGKLQMRTLLEKPAREVWLNDYGAKKVRAAAEGTTADQPFIVLDDPGDMDFVYRAVLNVLSEKFADAYVAQSVGLPVRFETYRFAITLERYDDIRTLKMRVLLVKEKELETLFAPDPPGGRRVEVPNSLYGARLKTLQMMHGLHAKAGQPGVPKLGRVVLGVRE